MEIVPGQLGMLIRQQSKLSLASQLEIAVQCHTLNGALYGENRELLPQVDEARELLDQIHSDTE